MIKNFVKESRLRLQDNKLIKALEHPTSRTKVIALGLLFVAVFITYFIFSLQFTGPAYLSDEVGYLSKAAALAGYSIDASSSYHAGYSVLLAPLFHLLTDPFSIWHGVQAVNAALFASSFIMLFFLLGNLFPKKSFLAIYLATVFCAVYPSWIIMNGYAFVTPVFVFIFIAITLLLTKLDSSKLWMYIVLGLLIGFLYWIHIFGLVVAFALFLAVTPQLIRKRRWYNLIAILLPVVVVISIYVLVISPWLRTVMTPSGLVATDHYSEISSKIPAVFSLRFWANVLLVVLGKFSYLLIATFGVVVFALVNISGRLQHARRTGSILSSNNTVYPFLVLSLIGIVFAGALMFNTARSDSSLFPSHWIYGRYSEMVLLPLLGMGLLSVWRFKYSLIGSTFLLMAGLALHYYTTRLGLDSWNNRAMIPAFWPQTLIDEVNFLYWSTAGAAGILLFAALNKRLAVLVAAPLIILSIVGQAQWHTDLLDLHSKPSRTLISLVRSSPVDCIGFREYDYPSSQWQRLNMYTFYFYDFSMKRMDYEAWQQSACDYYLTFEIEEREEGTIVIVGQESGYIDNLFLYAKESESVVMPEETNADFVPAVTH